MNYNEGVEKNTAIGLPTCKQSNLTVGVNDGAKGEKQHITS